MEGNKPLIFLHISICIDMNRKPTATSKSSYPVSVRNLKSKQQRTISRTIMELVCFMVFWWWTLTTRLEREMQPDWWIAWKCPFCFSRTSRNTNMLTQCCCFFVKYLQFCMKGKLSIFAGITFLTEKGKNIPLDLKVEFYNHILKSCLRMLGGNINAKSC